LTITNIQARIGGIAEKMNFYTAETENKTKTVKFNLERALNLKYKLERSTPCVMPGELMAGVL